MSEERCIIYLLVKIYWINTIIYVIIFVRSWLFVHFFKFSFLDCVKSNTGKKWESLMGNIFRTGSRQNSICATNLPILIAQGNPLGQLSLKYPPYIRILVLRGFFILCRETRDVDRKVEIFYRACHSFACKKIDEISHIRYERYWWEPHWEKNLVGWIKILLEIIR